MYTFNFVSKITSDKHPYFEELKSYLVSVENKSISKEDYEFYDSEVTKIMTEIPKILVKENELVSLSFTEYLIKNHTEFNNRILLLSL